MGLGPEIHNPRSFKFRSSTNSEGERTRSYDSVVLGLPCTKGVEGGAIRLIVFPCTLKLFLLNSLFKSCRSLLLRRYVGSDGAVPMEQGELPETDMKLSRSLVVFLNGAKLDTYEKQLFRCFWSLSSVRAHHFT